MSDRRAAVLVAIASTLVACFDPKFEPGTTCSVDVGCPGGLVCHPVDRVCVVTVVDAGPECGDGTLDADEECDDHNEVDGDGCEADCARTIVRLHAGSNFTCAQLRAGQVRCWGSGELGVLGHGDTAAFGDNEPVAESAFAAIGISVAAMDVGNQHLCAVGTSGTVRCWGDGGDGRLGYPGVTRNGDDELPETLGAVEVFDLPGPAVRQVSAGGNHSCAIVSGTGAVRCWGGGVLGYANLDAIGDNEPPSSAGDILLPGPADTIASGDLHRCVIFGEDRNVLCWGQNSSGQLGRGHTDTIGDTETPSEPAGTGVVVSGALQIVAGSLHTCALLDGGRVQCWGFGNTGALGYGNIENIGDNETLETVGDVDVGGVVAKLAGGSRNTCALLEGGAVRCWGSGSFGQPGHGNTDDIGDTETPASVGEISLGGPAVDVAVGSNHVCALLATGAVKCWGRNSSGELGSGNGDTIGDNELPSDADDVPVF